MTEQHNLWSALQGWRATSTKQRWRFYGRNGMAEQDRSEFYCDLVVRHDHIAKGVTP